MSSAFEGLPKTPNLKLNKPGYDNVADIEALNENADILDAEIQGIKNTFVKSVNGKEPDAAGNVNVEEYTHPNSGVTAGTYRSVTVNAQGHVTKGENPTKLSTAGLLDLIYPVGSIYMSMSATNPAELFGGTWEQIAQGRCLIGAGTGTDSRSESKTFTAGATGGEYNHVLTVGELASHNHSANSNSIRNHTHNVLMNSASGKGLLQAWQCDKPRGTYHEGTDGNGSHSHTITVDSRGDSAAHNNIQPYLAVYYWKRTA